MDQHAIDLVAVLKIKPDTQRSSSARHHLGWFERGRHDAQVEIREPGTFDPATDAGFGAAGVIAGQQFVE